MTHIPNSGDVQTPQGINTWRAVNGVICRGKEKEEGYEEWPHSNITGRISKLGLREGENKAGDYERKLILELETSEGYERLSVKFYSKKKYGSYSQFFGLSRALLLCDENEVIALTAARGSKPHPVHGTFATYINVYRVKEGCKPAEIRTNTPHEKRTESDAERDARVEREINGMIDDLKKLPFWGEYSHGSDDDDDDGGVTHRGQFWKECSERGWPTPDEAPEEWTSIVTTISEGANTSLNLNDDSWGELRLAINNQLKAKPDWKPKVIAEWIVNAKLENGGGAAAKPAEPKQRSLDDI